MSTPKERALCTLCETKPPRRFCPSIRQEICAPCCGTEREQTIDCPLDCEYLREARRHEKLPPFAPSTVPHREIQISDAFMERQQELAIVTGRLLLMGAMDVQGAVDLDMREALEALVKTYKTADSGLVYESRPANPYAAGIQERFQTEVARFREMVAQRMGAHTVLDKDLLGVLVFWQRMELQRSNGRRKGRAFIESLFSLLPEPGSEGEGSEEPPAII